MAVIRALTIVAALVALASLPCLIAIAIVGLDDLTYRGGTDRMRTLRLPGQTRRALWRFGSSQEDSIEQIAADLRALSRALNRLADHPDPATEIQREALRRAYQTRLQEACRALGVTEYLDDLVGIDRELELIRIEGVLEAEGLVLRSGSSRRREHP